VNEWEEVGGSMLPLLPQDQTENEHVMLATLPDFAPEDLSLEIAKKVGDTKP